MKMSGNNNKTWTVHFTTSPPNRHLISVFTSLWCIQCARIMRVILGPRARFGTALLVAAVCTSAWRMALWWLWSQNAPLSLHHCVRGRGSMYWMWWKKEPAARRRSVVSLNMKFCFASQSIWSKFELQGSAFNAVWIFILLSAFKCHPYGRYCTAPPFLTANPYPQIL